MGPHFLRERHKHSTMINGASVKEGNATANLADSNCDYCYNNATIIREARQCGSFTRCLLRVIPSCGEYGMVPLCVQVYEMGERERERERLHAGSGQRHESAAIDDCWSVCLSVYRLAKQAVCLRQLA